MPVTLAVLTAVYYIDRNSLLTYNGCGKEYN